MKKILSVILAALMTAAALTALPFTAAAADAQPTTVADEPTTEPYEITHPSVQETVEVFSNLVLYQPDVDETYTEYYMEMVGYSYNFTKTIHLKASELPYEWNIALYSCIFPSDPPLISYKPNLAFYVREDCDVTFTCNAEYGDAYVYGTGVEKTEGRYSIIEEVPTETTEPPETKPTETEPVDYPDGTVVLYGSSNFIETGWSLNPAKYAMTLGDDGIYSITVPNVKAEEGVLYQCTVTTLGRDWWDNRPYAGKTFILTKDCDVTVTYDPETEHVGVTGDGVAAPVYQIDSVTAVGSSNDDAFLRGVSWEPEAKENRLTEIAEGVYQITYEECRANIGYYNLYFVANDSYNLQWGAATTDTLETFGTPQTALMGGEMIEFYPESEAEYVDITLTLNLSHWDSFENTGATFTVEIQDSSFQPTYPTEEITTLPLIVTTAPVEVTSEPVPVTSQPPAAYLYGDANLDNVISVADATEIQKIVAGTAGTDLVMALADADGNGTVDINDATCVQKYIAEFNDGIGRVNQKTSALRL